MLRARQDQRRVDLVADHAGTVAHDDVADALELGAGEDPPPRIVRLGQQQRAGAVGEEPVEVVEIDLGHLGVGVEGQVPLFATSDLGQAVLRSLLETTEDAHVTAVIRPKGSVTGRKRLEQLLRKPVFSSWAELLGADGTDGAARL